MARAAAQAAECAQFDVPQRAVLDRDHLARMTFGDRSLEREVLQLFDRQAELLLDRMRTSEPPAIAREDGIDTANWLCWQTKTTGSTYMAAMFRLS